MVDVWIELGLVKVICFWLRIWGYRFGLGLVFVVKAIRLGIS